MSKFSDRGYFIKENGPVYFTKNMDRTVTWFENVLGWYSQIDERDKNGTGLYGCVYSVPPEIEKSRIAPFTGIHLFFGEPKTGLVAFMLVQGIDSLYKYVKSNGWDDITEIVKEPWGARLCCILTPDGYELRFFE
jgi:AraC family transcriptional regulator